jgi:hypothetical protein
MCAVMNFIHMCDKSYCYDSGVDTGTWVGCTRNNGEYETKTAVTASLYNKLLIASLLVQWDNHSH